MILSELTKFQTTWSVARPLCDSLAACSGLAANTVNNTCMKIACYRNCSSITARCVALRGSRYSHQSHVQPTCLNSPVVPQTKYRLFGLCKFNSTQQQSPIQNRDERLPVTSCIVLSCM